ncbi:MAG: translation initiation factor IF-2 [Patescibacteria group bacterium]|jgi:translation initiation factor IF-2
MNISTLAKKLGYHSQEMRKMIEAMGYRLRPTASKISDKKAKEITKKVEKLEKEKTLEMKEEQKKVEKAKEPKKLYVAQTITVKDFAQVLEMEVTDVIRQLIQEGIMATINEEIDFETASIIAEELGHKIELKKEEKDLIKEKGVRKQILEDLSHEEEKNLKPRPPVVVVMGHVDHGKTKLLDVIRETNIIATEAGGITQKIGAYQAKCNGKVITFLDTPGHEAFKAMRERGAKVTDMAILVVAADDGVMPQTEEAIAHAKNAGVPIIVAINKIDKEGADPEKVKRQLADLGLQPEDWGGDTIMVEISAKMNKNIDKLLEMVLLQAEILELKANQESKAIGTIIEANKDPKKGPVATVLIQNGTLNLGDYVTCGSIYGKIKAMENFLGKRINHAKPSTPVQILGLTAVPDSGDILQEEKSKEAAREKIAKIAKAEIKIKRNLTPEEERKIKKLNIILIADFYGSLEAIIDELNKINSKQVMPQIIDYSAGKITESNVMNAQSSNAIIFGFNSKPTTVASRLAEDKHVKIFSYDIIYELIDEIKKQLSSLIEPEVIKTKLGKLNVLAIFRSEKKRKIIGGRVLSGFLAKDSIVKIIREDVEIGQGKITTVQKNMADVQKVEAGSECGMSIDTTVKVKEGDVIEAWKEEIKKITL